MTATDTDRLAYVNDPEHPLFKRAMGHTCEICEAKPKRPCWNTLDSAAPLPGRLIHHARIHPKGRGKHPKDDA